MLQGDLVVTDIRELSSEQLMGPALLVDLTSVGPQQVVSQQLLEKAAADLRPGDIAVLWTGSSDRYYQRLDYLRWSPRFDLRGVESLLDRGVKMLVTDAASLEPHLWEASVASVVDPVLFARGVPAVVSATNLWLLREQRCFVICCPVPLRGLPMSPVRLVAVEDWD